jgi:serine/alanine adding enzyme
MELKVFEEPDQEWDEFAFRYTDLIFYHSIWSQVLKKGLGGQPLYFYLKEGGEVVTGLPGILLNFKIFKILYASIPYGHLIGEKAFYPSFMELLEKEFRKRGIDQVRMTGSPFSDPYHPSTFKTISAKCTLLDLSGFHEGRIGEGYRGEVRRAVRKAQRSGFFIRRAASRKDVEIFYRLYLCSMERNRSMAKYPLQWFHGLYEIMVHQKKGDFIFAVNRDDEYAAGVVLIYSSTSNHYLHNGSFETYLENRPNDLIVDHIIQEGVKEGKAVLDFMGSDPNDLSLIRFKEKWGGRSLDIYTHVKNYHPLRCQFWELGRRWGSSKIGRGLLKIFWD